MPFYAPPIPFLGSLIPLCIAGFVLMAFCGGLLGRPCLSRVVAPLILFLPLLLRTAWTGTDVGAPFDFGSVLLLLLSLGILALGPLISLLGAAFQPRSIRNRRTDHDA